MPRAAPAGCSPDQRRTDEQLREDWRHERPLIEFLASQPAGCFSVSEEGDELVGYVLVARFGSMDEMAELWVAPSHGGRGVSRGLLERCWPEDPDPRPRADRGGVGHPRRPHVLHPVRRDARERALAHAPAGRPLPRAPRCGGRGGRARGACTC